MTEANTVDAVYNFMIERLKGIYADAGTANDLFEAVAAVQPESIADFEHRVRAVADFRKLPEADALAAANKRISNILRKAERPIPGAADPDLFEMDAERELHEQIKTPGGTDQTDDGRRQLWCHLAGPVGFAHRRSIDSSTT